MSKHSTPYHGPHVILSRKEIERLDELMKNHSMGRVIPVEAIDGSICNKIDAALTSDPDFLEPAK